MKADDQALTHADQLQNTIAPEEQEALVGHQAAFNSILDAHANGKLHHAWLVTGQKGIGKATFCFSVARALFTATGNETPERVTEMVAAGSHPNLKIIRRSFNHKTSKYMANVSVDVVRDAVKFFQTSAATAGLRICIVDSLDDMNANAANALLKTLEEPPANTLFLLISNQLGRVLPTIRSRCRLLRLTVLDDKDVNSVVSQQVEGLGGSDLGAILEIARGRPRKAFEALMADGDANLRALGHWLQAPNVGDAGDVMKLGASIAQSKDDTVWSMALEMLENSIAWRTKHLLAIDQHNPMLANALAVWEKTEELLANQAIFNLDKKQTIIMILDAIRDLDRVAPMNIEPSI